MTTTAPATSVLPATASPDRPAYGSRPGYSAHLVLDLVFHTQHDLHQYLTAVHLTQLPGADPDRTAWAIVADLIEYADATLTGRHLTGHGTGTLLPDYPDRIQALARHADGTITAVGEDKSTWSHRLREGHAVLHLENPEDPHHHPTLPGTDLAACSQPPHTRNATRRATDRLPARGRS